MPDDNDTFTVRDVGIGDEEVRERLEDDAAELDNEFGHAIAEIAVNNDILSGLAHIGIEFNRRKSPAEFDDRLVEYGLFIASAKTTERGYLEYRVTTAEILNRLRDVYVADEEANADDADGGADSEQ